MYKMNMHSALSGSAGGILNILKGMRNGEIEVEFGSMSQKQAYIKIVNFLTHKLNLYIDGDFRFNNPGGFQEFVKTHFVNNDLMDIDLLAEYLRYTDFNLYDSIPGRTSLSKAFHLYEIDNINYKSE